MNFHQLFCFCKVAEKRSFSKAAEEAFISQSTISTHISNLEKHFGEKLFDRLTKEAVLTPFGEKLYYWAIELLKLKEAAIWDLKDWTGKIEGYLNIAASTVPAQYMLPKLIAKFLKDYPDIQFGLTQLSSEAVAEKLLKGDVDLGLLGEKFYADKLDYIPFIQEKLVLITPPHIFLEPPVTMQAVKDMPFIFRKAGSGTQMVIEKLLKQSGTDISLLKIVGYFDSVQAIKQCVKENIGVSIISEIAAKDYGDSNLINVYSLEDINQSRYFYFAYNKQKTLSPLMIEFINMGKCITS